MAKINIEKLNTEELEQLRRQIDARLEQLEHDRRRTALEEIQAVARKHGVAVAELLGNAKLAKRNAPGPAKYRHPENPEMTWTGRGRQPGWVKEHLAANRDLSDLKVA